MSQPPCEKLTKDDLSVELLKALSWLTPQEREAWIDRHILGHRTKGGADAAYVRSASARIARLLRLKP